MKRPALAASKTSFARRLLNAVEKTTPTIINANDHFFLNALASTDEQMDALTFTHILTFGECVKVSIPNPDVEPFPNARISFQSGPVRLEDLKNVVELVDFLMNAATGGKQ